MTAEYENIKAIQPVQNSFPIPPGNFESVSLVLSCTISTNSFPSDACGNPQLLGTSFHKFALLVDPGSPPQISLNFMDLGFTLWSLPSSRMQSQEAPNPSSPSMQRHVPIGTWVHIQPDVLQKTGPAGSALPANRAMVKRCEKSLLKSLKPCPSCDNEVSMPVHDPKKE